jgi:hypothetical protein
MSFLSKKSWHVKSGKNIARVREAEEAAAAEAKKTEQRRRELQEEREMDTLRKLQGKSGSSEGSSALDWMYKTPMDVRDDKLQEEYLLGKQMPEKRTETVIEKVGQASGSLFVKSTPAPGAAADLKAKLREDPLMLIKQREAQHIRSMSATQAHLHRIREQDIEADHHRRREKEERKDASKEKQKHKHKHKHRSHRHEDGSNDEEERRKHKKRRREEEESTNGDSAKKPKLEEPKSSHSAPKNRHESTPHDQRSRSPPHGQREKDQIQGRSGPPNELSEVPSSHEHSKRSFSGNGRDQPSSFHGYESHRRREDYDRSSSSHAPYPRSSEYDDRRRYDQDEFGRRRRDDRAESVSGYAESHSRRPEHQDRDHAYQRPDYDSKRYGGHSERYDDRRSRENRSGAVPGMTEEERIRMLEQMQGRAQVLHHARSTLIEDSKAEESREQAMHRAAAQETQARGEMPTFVTKMNEEVIKSTSVEDRVTRGRFYMQKGD